MIYLIAILSGIIAGMGIGGGSIFILLATSFSLLPHKVAQAYTLIMFIIVGISATIVNLKNKTLKIDLLKKIIVPVCIGSVIGMLINQQIEEEKLRFYFYIFMLIIGSYEIFKSLKNILSGHNKE